MVQEVSLVISGKREARGMFWLADEKAFSRLKAAAPDKDALGETYGAWRTMALRVFNRANRVGDRRVQVNVSMNAFLFWCQQTGNPANEEARDGFAQIELARMARVPMADAVEN